MSESKISELEERVRKLEKEMPKKKVNIVMFSGELDRCLAAFIIATGAAGMGFESTMFFTFWGLSALRKNKKYQGKKLIDKMMTLMSPGGPEDLPLSNMHFFGLGSRMMKKHMAEKNIMSLEDLIELSKELGVRMIGCEMTINMLDYSDEELLEGVEFGGVGAFLAEAIESRVTLFI